MNRRGVLLLAAVLAVPLFGGQARRGWVKLELTNAAGRSGAIPVELLTGFGAEPMVQYQTYAILYAPAGAFESIKRRAEQLQVNVRRREEMDLLQLPGSRVLDAREGIGAEVPATKLTRHYPPGKPGLFVLQFSAPARPEWAAQLQTMGWILSRYVPNNGYVAIGRPELIGATRQLPFVQYLDFFHPYQKWAHVTRDGKIRELMFELASSPDPTEAIERIRAAAKGDLRVDRNALDTLVFASMTAEAAEALLEDPLVISVSHSPKGSFSDERQAMSLTSNINVAGSAPTSPTGYWNWVLSRCPNCSSMAASVWKIGIADTGLDTGLASSGHPDLNGRKYFGGQYFDGLPETCGGTGLGPHRDCYSHGTMVAGMAAGDGSGTGALDQQGGYLIGTGIAPTAGIFSTKVFTTVPSPPAVTTNINLAYVAQFTNDAAANGVTIQNHSFNEYGVNQEPDMSGIYSPLARRYDILVRDADETMTDPLRPLLISVSAGNRNQGHQNANRWRVLGGATAKNVLAMGGVESYRPQYTSCNGGSKAEDFRNIMAVSRTGTLMPGYIKPDLVAASTMIVGTHPTPVGTVGYCQSPFENHLRGDGGPLYTMESGTSFAAPVGAGAALLVKRYLGTTPGATSPALTKATLIAGAKSVRGGLDRSGGGLGTTVGAAPNGQQGFGRISLDDVLTGTTPPVTLDQSATRLFTENGQVYRTRLRVRDSSKPVKVALVWTDTPATAGAGTTNPLVNDLNLEIDPRLPNNYVVYVGNKLEVTDPNKGEESIGYWSGSTPPYDNVNNAEFARFFLPAANHEFDVAVKAWSIWGNTDTNTSTWEQDFALVVVNADVVNNGNPIAPKIRASVESVPITTSAYVFWEPASNMFVTSYDVYKGDNVNNFQFVHSTPYHQGAAHNLALNKAYVFKVVANGPAGQSVTSNFDFVAMMNFQNSVSVGATIDDQHFNELRTGIDYIRAAALLPTNSWTEAINSGTVIKASHMNEMRDKLEAALTPYGAPLPAYDYPDPVAGTSLIRAADIADLREALYW